MNISGGDVSSSFRAESGSTINLFVTELFLDSVPQELSSGAQIEIDTSVDFVLEATLADGSFINFATSGPFIIGNPFDEGSILTVTMVPEPSSLTMLALAGFSALCRRRLNGVKVS